MGPFLDAGNDLWGLDRREALSVLLAAVAGTARPPAAAGATFADVAGPVRAYLAAPLRFPTAAERDALARHLCGLTPSDVAGLGVRFAVPAPAPGHAGLVAKMAARVSRPAAFGFDPGEAREPAGSSGGGRWTSGGGTAGAAGDASTAVSEMADIVAEGEYEHYGLRVEDGRRLEVGEESPPSRVWLDGDPTDEEMDGTSALEVKGGDVGAALKKLATYYGDRLVLLGSYTRTRGEDPGEALMKGAVVLWEGPRVGPRP